MLTLTLTLTTTNWTVDCTVEMPRYEVETAETIQALRRKVHRDDHDGESGFPLSTATALGPWLTPSRSQSSLSALQQGAPIEAINSKEKQDIFGEVDWPL